MPSHRFAALALFIMVGLTGACSRSPQQQEARFLKRAQELAAKKDYGRALLELRNAAHATPKDAEPYYRIGEVLLATGDARGGFAALQKALALNPNHAAAKLKISELMALSHQTKTIEAAEKDLRGFLKASPDNVEALNTLALTELKLGKPEDADKLLEETLSKFPTDLQTSVALARLRLVRKDYTGAEQVLKQAVQNAPKSPAATLALGVFYGINGKPRESETEIRRAVRLDPKNGSALLALGTLEMSDGRRNEADETFRLLSALPDKQYRTVYASFLWQTGNRLAAIGELERLIKEDRNDREARDQLVRAYIAVGQEAKAEDILNDALTRNPRDTDALLERSNIYQRLGQPSKAEKDLQTLVYFKPNSAEAHYAIASLNLAAGHTLMARQQLSQALALDPSFLLARLRLAHQLTISEGGQSALDLLDQAPEAQRHSPSFLIERNWALLAIGHMEDLSTGIAEGFTAAKARVPELVLQEGLLLFEQEHYAEARKCAEELIHAAPNDSRGAELLMNTYAAQKQLSEGVRRMRELASQNPKSASLEQVLGRWLTASGNRDAARNAFTAAKSANPKLTQADVALASMDVSDGKIEQARQNLNDLLRADPGNLRALMLLASADEEAGDHAAAIVHYQSVLQKDPNNVFALNNLANVLVPINLDKAMTYALKAAEMAPGNGAVQDTLGWIFYSKGMYSDAIQHLTDAVAQNPSPRRQFHLAMAYLRAGNREVGGKLLEAAVAKDPNLPKSERGW